MIESSSDGNHACAFPLSPWFVFHFYPFSSYMPRAFFLFQRRLHWRLLSFGATLCTFSLLQAKFIQPVIESMVQFTAFRSHSSGTVTLLRSLPTSVILLAR